MIAMGLHKRQGLDSLSIVKSISMSWDYNPADRQGKIFFKFLLPLGHEGLDILNVHQQNKLDRSPLGKGVSLYTHVY